MTSDGTGRGSDKFMLRLPDGMRERISEEAKANKRTMNAEIIARLQVSFEQNAGLSTDRAAIREVVMQTTGHVVRSILEAFDSQPKDKRDNINEIIMRAGAMLDENDSK